MIFVINNLKYDTDKMELISDECEYWYKGELLGTPMRYRGRDDLLVFSMEPDDLNEQLKELESEDPKTCTFIYRFIKTKLNK